MAGRATLGGSGWAVPGVAEDGIQRAQATADAAIKDGAGLFYGVIVKVAIATAAVDIRDAVAAGAGTVLLPVPSGTAAGAVITFGGLGVPFTAGLFADFGGTGTIDVLYA
jgi:hypothetical protein